MVKGSWFDGDSAMRHLKPGALAVALGGILLVGTAAGGSTESAPPPTLLSNQGETLPSVASLTRNLPHQVFYASFDNGLAADYARGLAEPIANGYTSTKTPGHNGTAFTFTQSGKNSRLFYDAPGNIHPSRGSSTMWFKPDSEEAGKPYCRPTLMGVGTQVEGYWHCLMIWGPTYHGTVTPMDRSCGTIYDGNHGRHTIFQNIEHWKKGEWRHLAMVWDSRMGIKLYENGEPLASRWGIEHGWAEIPDCPVRQLTFGMFNAYFRGGGKTGYAIDEVRIFDVALSEQAVKAIYEGAFGGPLPPETIPDETFARTLERMSWADPDRQALVPIEIWPDEVKPVLIRVNAIDESVDAKRPMSHLSDGLPTSGWPHPTYGSRFSGKEVTIKLRQTGRFNRIELDVLHGFTGRFVSPAPGEVAPPKNDINVPSGRTRWSASLDKPFIARSLKLQREAGRIGEVRLWEILKDEKDLGTAKGKKIVYTASGRPDEATLNQSLAGRMARQSFAGEAICWKLEQADEESEIATPTTISRLSPLAPIFFISEPITKDISAGAVTFKLELLDAPADSVLRLELRDPIWPTRRLFQGDFRLEGGGIGVAEVRVDLPDFFVGGRKLEDDPFPEKGDTVAEWQARRPLRLMASVTASSPLALKRFELIIHETDRAEAIAEHDSEQLPYIREGFADTVEPRPYGWHVLAYEKLYFPLFSGFAMGADVGSAIR